jgi:hypothetical protein
MAYIFPIFESFLIPAPEWLGINLNYFPTTANVAIDLLKDQEPILLTHYTYNDLVFGGAKRSGLKASEMYDIFYNQIWLSLTNISAGLVSTDQYYNFYIWNAYTQKVNLPQIQNNALDGISFSVSLLGAYNPLVMKSTVIKIQAINGQPVINGSFGFLFDIGGNYNLFITGLRIATLPLVHIIPDSFEFTLSYALVNAVNMFLKEQRRNLVDTPLRGYKAKAFVDDMSYGTARTSLDQHGGKLFAVSIPFERVTPTASNLNGLTSITVNEDISKYTEITTCPLIVVYQKSTQVAYCLEVASVDTTNKAIALQYPATSSLPANDIEIYPAFYGVINNITQDGKAGKFAMIDFEAKEVFI